MSLFQHLTLNHTKFIEIKYYLEGITAVTAVNIKTHSRDPTF
jgi:hypothetical protein